jgi:hypothetical protein
MKDRIELVEAVPRCNLFITPTQIISHKKKEPERKPSGS